jgi:predicted nucleic acid-binding protein
VIPTRTITICRDPKDNKFIEAALEGNADWIVTGDAELLDLESFENISMLRPAEFLVKL